MEEEFDQSDTLHLNLKTRRRMSMEKREEVRRLLFEGISRRQIAKKMNVSSSVIWRLEKKLQETGTVQDRHGGGRPRIAYKPSEHWVELDGEFKFQCTHCDKLFVHHAQIREHLRTHTGERPYKCDQCFQAFATTSTLKRHLVKHTANRPFMCDICAKQFADNGSLRIHLRIHTGDKPYKCDFCDRRCVTRGNLNAHMRIHRDEEKILEGEGSGQGRRRRSKKLVLPSDTSEEESPNIEEDTKYAREGTIKDSGANVGDIIKEMITDEAMCTNNDHGNPGINHDETENRLCNTKHCDTVIGNCGNDAKTHGKWSSNYDNRITEQESIDCKSKSDDKMREIKIEVELHEYAEHKRDNSNALMNRKIDIVTKEYNIKS